MVTPDHVADDMRQAARLRATMRQVAELLGYTLVPPAAPYLYRDAVRLHGPDGQALAVTRRHGVPGRIVVHGVYPHHPGTVVGLLPPHTISVALARSVPAIAHDIQRRLLPRYTEHLATAHAAMHRYEHTVRSRQRVVAELLATVAGLRRGVTSADRVTLHLYTKDGPHGDVEVRGCGDELALTLSGPTSRLLPAFLTALRDDHPAASSTAMTRRRRAGERRDVAPQALAPVAANTDTQPAATSITTREESMSPPIPHGHRSAPHVRRHSG